MKTQKDIIKRFREVITPQDAQSGTIPNLLKMFAQLPSTPQESIQPTQQAPEQPEATLENVQASMEEPQGKLSKNYPYGGA